MSENTPIVIILCTRLLFVNTQILIGFQIFHHAFISLSFVFCLITYCMISDITMAFSDVKKEKLAYQTRFDFPLEKNHQCIIDQCSTHLGKFHFIASALITYKVTGQSLGHDQIKLKLRGKKILKTSPKYSCVCFYLGSVEI